LWTATTVIQVHLRVYQLRRSDLLFFRQPFAINPPKNFGFFRFLFSKNICKNFQIIFIWFYLDLQSWQLHLEKIGCPEWFHKNKLRLVIKLNTDCLAPIWPLYKKVKDHIQKHLEAMLLCHLLPKILKFDCKRFEKLTEYFFKALNWNLKICYSIYFV